MKLLRKIALITGAGSGIERASTILFAQEGTTVVIACRNMRNGQDTADRIIQNGGKAICVRADVSKAEDVERLIFRLLSQTDLYLQIFQTIFRSSPWIPFRMFTNSVAICIAVNIIANKFIYSKEILTEINLWSIYSYRPKYTKQHHPTQNVSARRRKVSES
jgi:NAD(P)-dependent dehydrogenase (short-subunit alcohol dehydrogenase family)